MKLTDDEKQMASLLIKKNSDIDYVMTILEDTKLIASEIKENSQIRDDLVNEKESHEKHISYLSLRIKEITVLLETIKKTESNGKLETAEVAEEMVWTQPNKK